MVAFLVCLLLTRASRSINDTAYLKDSLYKHKQKMIIKNSYLFDTFRYIVYCFDISKKKGDHYV